MSKNLLSNIAINVLAILLISASIAVISHVAWGYDPYAILPWSITDWISGGNADVRGFGTIFIISLFVAIQVLIRFIKRMKIDWANIALQMVYGLTVGSIISLFITILGGGVIDSIDFASWLDSQSGSTRTITNLLLTFSMMFVLGFGVALLLKANVITTAFEQTALLISEITGIGFTPVKMTMDIIFAIVGLLIVLVANLELSEFFNFGTVIFTFTAGPIIGTFYKILPFEGRK